MDPPHEPQPFESASIRHTKSGHPGRMDVFFRTQVKRTRALSCMAQKMRIRTRVAVWACRMGGGGWEETDQLRMAGAAAGCALSPLVASCIWILELNRFLASGSGGWWLVLFRTGVRGIPWVRQSSALVRQELRRGTGGRS